VTLSDIMDALSFVSVPDLREEQQFELLSIRNQQIIRESSYSSHVIEDNEHLRWIEQLQTDPSLTFYAVLYDEEIVGGVGLRNIDAEKNTAEWSFYVSEGAAGRGIGLGLGIMALDLFFEELCLETVIGEALLANKASVTYHLKLGFREIAQQQHLVQPGNRMDDIAVFSLEKTDWQNSKAAFGI